MKTSYLVYTDRYSGNFHCSYVEIYYDDFNDALKSYEETAKRYANDKEVNVYLSRFESKYTISEIDALIEKHESMCIFSNLIDNIELIPIKAQTDIAEFKIQ